jgi:hypothetical protein
MWEHRILACGPVHLLLLRRALLGQSMRLEPNERRQALARKMSQELCGFQAGSGGENIIMRRGLQTEEA